MELVESIERINYWLQREYGRFDDARSNFRVVWSEDQYERRKREGYEIPQSMKKYGYLKDVYILERIMPVPEYNSELTTDFSYEPIWVFLNKDNKPLPPRIDVCKLVIEALLKQAAKSVGAKYKDPEAGHDPLEVRAERVRKLQEELFGNETDTTDLLAAHEGVVVPRNYGENN
jgi:hypothetical protein